MYSAVDPKAVLDWLSTIDLDKETMQNALPLAHYFPDEPLPEDVVHFLALPQTRPQTRMHFAACLPHCVLTDCVA